jgi:ABC-type Fe3+ transport system substrate-binding protein
MLIPNTIAVLRQAPHPDAARRLFDYLRGGEVAGRLVDVHALEAASPGEAALVTLKPDWSLLVRELEPATETLRRIFLR